MKNFQKLFFAVLTVGSMALTGCLHIIEEVTFKNKGSGQYAMTLDMSEVKGMMEMLKTMSPDSTGSEMPGEGQDNSMAQMGQEISGVATTLKGIQGISNVVELNDTSAFKFGYSFDFVDVAALNRALKVVNKDKYDSKVDEVFKFSGKNFERLSAGDMGEEIKKALSEGGEEEEGGEETMDMMKMMFVDMSYKQIYHFPDREIKKSNNDLAELSDDKHTMTITIKPFDEEQAKKKATVAAEVKFR